MRVSEKDPELLVVTSTPVVGEQVVLPEVTAEMDSVDQEKKTIDVQQVILNLQEECEKICLENSDNFLFFTKYGGVVTQEKFDKDPKTDLDLRLVCFDIPDEDEQKKIVERLELRSGDLPIELYFHSFDKYITGEVGETGNTNVFEAMLGNHDPQTTIINLEHPSMLSLYTFSTMTFFPDQSHKKLLKSITDVVEKRKKKNLITDEQIKHCNLESLDPRNILKKIELTREGIIEWIHLYLKSFLLDYHAMKALSLEEQSSPEVLYKYLKRLSKYLLRIGFGISILDSDLDSVKENYIEEMSYGIAADQVHMDLLHTERHSWFKEDIRNTMTTALEIREYPQQFTQENVSRELQFKIENTLLFVAQQVGGILRREKLGEVHDFLTELAFINLLTPMLDQDEFPPEDLNKRRFKVGEEIFSQGEMTDGVCVVLEGGYDVVVNATRMNFDRNKVILGELATILGIERTASILVTKDIEAFMLSKSFMKELFESTFVFGKESESLLRYFLSLHFSDYFVSVTEIKKALLIFSFLNYLSSEFIQYLYENIDSGKSFVSESKPHILEQYRLPYFSEILYSLGKGEKLEMEEFNLAIENDPKVVFSAGDTDNEYIYVITECAPEGGVELQVPHSSDTTVLKKNDVFGESSLLPGNKLRNYSALLLPGTTVTRIQAKEFQELTMTTANISYEIHEVPEDFSTPVQKIKEISGAELFFHVGVNCLDKIQQLN